MKKMLFFATLVACSLMFFSCEKKNNVDPNEAAIAQVKADAQGTWEGTTEPLYGDGEFVTITFTEKKVTAVFEDDKAEANILAWKCVDGKEVWIEMDDDMKSALYVAVSGDKMTTKGNSTFTVNVFPPTMTRVKK